MKMNREIVVLGSEFPSLVLELESGLADIDEPLLSKSIRALEVHGRCECGQENCGTFYTKPKPEWEGQRLRQVIPVVKGLMAMDVHESAIVCVEFLGRSDVVAFLDKTFGPQAHD